MELERIKELDFFKNFESNYLNNLFQNEMLIYDWDIPKYKILKQLKDIFKLHKKCFNKQYWIDRGWSIQESEEKILEISKKGSKKAHDNFKNNPNAIHENSPMKIETWIKKGYTEEEAIFKIKSFRKLNKEYWLIRNYTEEEAKEKVFEFQKTQSDKRTKAFRETPENYKDILPNQLNYWIKKGYTEEEAKEKLKERQTTFTLEKCISKYGKDEGKRIYNERQEKWQSTLNSKSKDEIKRINKSKAITLEKFIKKYGFETGIIKYNNFLERKTVNLSKASKISLKIFIPIYKYLRNNNIDKNDIYFGIDGSKEYFLKDKNRLYFYDFTIKSKKIIIEFHGKVFHPNYKTMSLNEIKVWTNPFNISGLEIMKNDITKEELAKKNGFRYLVIYEEDGIEQNINEIKEFLVKELNI